jgi:hypothetical protein
MIGWKPASIPSFVTDYLGGMSDSELVKKYGGTTDQVKHIIRTLRKKEGLPSRDELKAGATFQYTAEQERIAFRKFLLRAKTLSEIQAEFGDLSETLLAEKHLGLNLFEQINNFGEKIYILLPEVGEEDWRAQVKERIWSYHQSESLEGPWKQPYQMIQMPDGAFVGDEIIIAPIYDVHLGHYAHKREKLLAYLRWIEETPNVYTFIGGDFAENALDDGRGMTYSQEIPPSLQVKRACELLAPIAHKILFVLSGNHEHRTEKKTDIDPSAVVASYLNIPHYAGPVYCSILGKGRRWKLYAFHGNTSSQTKGGKLNAAGRPRRFTDFIHFYVSGHTHDPMVNNETCLVEDPERCRLTYQTQWIITCPSFLGWENTYAYVAGWPPPGKGGVALNLYSNGNYEAIARDRS